MTIMAETIAADGQADTKLEQQLKSEAERGTVVW